MLNRNQKIPDEHRRPLGYSLLELVIVVLTLGIVASIAIPRYTTSVDRYRAQIASQRLAQDIELCRRHARFTSQNVTLIISYAKNLYSVSPMDSPLRPGTPYQVVLGEDPTHPFICPVIDGNPNRDSRASQSNLTIVFDRYGVPNQSAEIGILCGKSSVIVRLTAEGVVTRS